MSIKLYFFGHFFAVVANYDVKFLISHFMENVNTRRFSLSKLRNKLLELNSTKVELNSTKIR